MKTSQVEQVHKDGTCIGYASAVQPYEIATPSR